MPAGCATLGVAELTQRTQALYALGHPCRWCPRECGADRMGGAVGVCGGASGAVVASAGLHFGEEEHFVGAGGSGTVFFAGCNLGCVFCQNWEISHGREGRELDEGELAGVMLSLQNQGAENINLVTPSHYPAAIMAALAIATGEGLRLPVVWNSSGYDSVETLRFFEGVVDIYMPDLKFASDSIAARYTQAANYASVARLALAEMVRQVGPGLSLRHGAAVRGISVRHLVMPGLYDDSCACLDFLHSLNPEITVNIMRQYHPEYMAHTMPEINRRPTREVYNRVVAYARGIGLRNVLADQASG